MPEPCLLQDEVTADKPHTCTNMLHALHLALLDKQVLLQALSFLAPKAAGRLWLLRSMPVLAQVFALLCC
jgi:hypothetical protein